MPIACRWSLLIYGLASLIACSPLQTSTRATTNIKVGTLYDLRQQKIIQRDALIHEIIASDFVVLGERHDNPHHHQLQLWILEQLQRKNWLQQLNMEMITPAQEKNFQTLSPTLAQQPQQLQVALAWQDTGWPWEDYKALVQLAVKHSLPLRSANIDEADIKAVYKGTQPAPPVQLTPEARAELLKDIEDSHCGYLKAPQTLQMLSVQLARDRAIANSLIQSPRGVALIAGAFHARKDLGFPLHLQQLHSQKRLLAMAFVEADEVSRAADLKALAQTYDLIWVTPVHPREDPCAELRKGLP